MDAASVFDLISRTFADQLDGYAVFETTSGESLRVDLAINEQWFRATFQDSTGPILVVTPGNITALENGQPVQSESVETQAALDAWKSQPPITLAPISAGLSQLQATNTQINQIISSLLRVTGGGSLAVAFIPTLCWFNARYPQVLLPGLVLQELEGRVCLRDIAFTSSEISFAIEVHGQCKSSQLNFGKSFTMQVQELKLDLHTSSHLELPTGNVEAEIWHSSLATATGTGKVEINVSGKPSSLPLEVEGLATLINDIKLQIVRQSGSNVETYVFGGPVVLQAKQATIAKYDFEWDLDVVSVASANLADLYVDITFNSRRGSNPYLSGSFSIPNLIAKVNAQLSDIAAKNLEAKLSLQGQFSSSHLAINHVSLASSSGQVIFKDKKFGDFIIDNFETSILVSDLIVYDEKLENGNVQVALYPATGDEITVNFPKEVFDLDIRLKEFKSGRFAGADLSLKFSPSIKDSISTLVFLNGYIEVGLLELNLDGKLVPLRQRDGDGSTFRVSVDRFTYSKFSASPPLVRLSACVDNFTKPIDVSLDFNKRKLNFQLDKVRANIWSVGEFDSRVAGQLTASNGKISGTDGALKDVTLKNASVRVLSDEYHPSRDEDFLAVRRRLFTLLELEIGRIKKKLAGKEFSPERIPANEAALADFLKDQLDQDYAFLIDWARGAAVLPGFVELLLYLQIEKITFEFNFNPTKSSQSKLVFEGSAIFEGIKIIGEVWGQIGICPLCKRKRIKSVSKSISASYTETLGLEVPIDFDLATNRIYIRQPKVEGLKGVLSKLAEPILNFLIELLIPETLLTIDIPSDIKVNVFRLEFGEDGDEEIEILLDIAAEKVQFE